MSNWHIEGSYFETCNCDAICPCRRQGEKPGGDSTYDDCVFLLSWWIKRGNSGDIDLGGVRTALAGRYRDDEENKPWTIILYIDQSASDAQFDALSDIFLGRVGGDIAFARNIADIAAVKRADIVLDHREGQETIRIGETVSGRMGQYVDHDFTVTCGITGHDKPGRESVCDSRVVDGPFDWSYEGRCGFSSRFAYKAGTQ